MPGVRVRAVLNAPVTDAPVVRPGRSSRGVSRFSGLCVAHRGVARHRWAGVVMPQERYAARVRSDADGMTSRREIGQHHWLNTFVGVIDAAFWLSDEEQYQVIGILRRLLTTLRIPQRGEPVELPVPLVLEVDSAFYSVALDAAQNRPVRPVDAADIVVSVETWRDALLSMLLVAYPDLRPEERLVAAKIFDDLLTALGVPDRAAVAFPDTVIRAYQQSPDAQL